MLRLAPAPGLPAIAACTHGGGKAVAGISGTVKLRLMIYMMEYAKS
jgi:hypothetical protein